MIQLLADMKTLCMPMQALIHTFHTRLMPAMLYGVELTVHVAKFDKLFNGLQATCLRRLLACCGLPRIVLLHELGIQDRWSALAWMRAIALKRRVQADPRYWQEHAIFVLAEDESTTWAAAVASQEHACGLRPLPTELQSEFLTPKTTKSTASPTLSTGDSACGESFGTEWLVRNPSRAESLGCLQ